MNPQDIDAVQASWAQVEPIAPQAAELFYNNLFELDPTLQSLFRGDMQAQGQKLMQMIGAAVGKLNDLGTLLPILQSLGQRHGGYGVVDSHYELVGTALLKTLGQGLGEAFDDTTRAAWTRVYGVIASTMTSAVAQPA
ncbi:MAG TPA: globin family protein [Ideonella sp.]|nr:globin family protein [Ideonella sp.]